MNIPSIIKESNSGYHEISISSEMLKNRHIHCMGTIDEASVNSIINQLLYLEREDPNAPIVLLINSGGGNVQDGLCLIDVMKLIKCPVTTVCIGLAASMAAVIFACGDKRLLLESSRVMIHDPLIQSTGGSALKLNSTCEQLMKIRDHMAEILSQCTGRTKEEILDKTKEDTFFSSDEAIDFGLADAVLKSTDEIYPVR